MTNKTYDILKWITQIVLPALGTLYFALASIWHMPYPQEVVGTIVAIDTFLGVLLGVSTTQYNKNDANFDGVMKVVEDNPETKKYSLEMNTPLDDIPGKHALRLKVNPTHNDELN